MSTLSVYLQTWRLKLSHTKMVRTAFHLNNRKPKCELKVYNNNKLLPFCPTPSYLGIKQDRSLMFHHHLVALHKNFLHHIAEATCGLRMGYWFQSTIHSCLSLVYSTAEYCTPVWYHSAHTFLINSLLNDALCIVTGCLHPTPMDHLPILSNIQPAELCQLGATLSLAHCGSLDPNHMLYDLLSGPSDAFQKRLRFRCPLVPTVQNQLNNLVGFGICASGWTNHKWNTEYCESAFRLCVFIPRASARPVEMNLL